MNIVPNNELQTNSNPIVNIQSHGIKAMKSFKVRVRIFEFVKVRKQTYISEPDMDLMKMTNMLAMIGD